MPIITDPLAASDPSSSGMTFLAICKRLRQEARGTGTGPATVVGQSGDMKSIVDWASDSYRDIQKAKRSWRWLWEDVEIPITSGQREYTLAQIAALVPAFTRHAHWKPNGFKYYVTSEGVASERKLGETLFERAYEREYGTVPSAVRPNGITVLPNGTLRLAQTPTADGVLTATHYRTAQILAADADVPEMPNDFHMLIVWHALSDFGIVEAASEIYERSVMKKAKMFSELMIDQLEPVENYATTLAG